MTARDALRRWETALNVEKLLTTQEAAALLRLSPVTLACWRATGAQPELRYIKVGRRVRYAESDVIAWLQARRSSPSAAALPSERGT
jgi:excisionase family DNA binding protein